MQYLTSCVNLSRADVPDLHAMIDSARAVTYGTFRKNVGAEEMDDWASGMGYAVGSGRGLRLGGDWHVRFCKSKWKGRKCYYIVHSGTEYIWI
jgi:hypothetical protein